jgi:hypothetical protein
MSKPMPLVPRDQGRTERHAGGDDLVIAIGQE